MSAHIWFKPHFLTYECCRDCGIVKRRDGENSPCKGPVKVALRAAEPLPQTAPTADAAGGHT